MGVLATLYIECFISLWVLGTLYMFYQVMGVLATLYIECFDRLWGFADA